MTKAEKLLEAVDPLDATRDVLSSKETTEFRRAMQGYIYYVIGKSVVYDPGKTGPGFLGTLAGKLAEELFTEFIEELSDKIAKLKP